MLLKDNIGNTPIPPGGIEGWSDISCQGTVAQNLRCLPVDIGYLFLGVQRFNFIDIGICTKTIYNTWTDSLDASGIRKKRAEPFCGDWRALP